ncbi:uncharacterized protein LOC142656001 isoform X2 [Rhinoderma darwinii]|uniref:uncharacterized protein LOC142656001 isoform X2 n=1 Tax=Rhinoderma darwinii TaxID=43563 RepID=UPI003F676BC9
MEASDPVDGVCRLLYEQLVILFHPHECDQCRETCSIIQYSAVPLCASVDAVLSHMKYCRAGMSCQIPGCPSARAVMSHWKICRKKECPVALNLSKDRKRKIQLLLQEEVKSFFTVQTVCHHLYNQLVFLFRIHDCEACADNDYQHYSSLPLCQSVDTILGHIKYCRAGLSCKVPRCSAARTIISHWMSCQNKECPVVWNLSKDRIQNTKKQIHQKNMLPSVIRADNKTAKELNQTLFVMFHAWSCMCRRRLCGIFWDCDLPQCQPMQNLLKHIDLCVAGCNCKYPNCNITRFIFLHYMACLRPDCEICWPLRIVIKQLCGTEDCATCWPSLVIWEGIPFTPTSVFNNVSDPWFSTQVYRWIRAQDKPLIGPPLFQKIKPQNRIHGSVSHL